MGSTSLWLGAHQAELAHPLEHTHVCLDQAVLDASSDPNRGARSVPDRAIDGAGLPVGATVDDGVVGLLGELLEEGLLEEGVRLLVLGQDVDAAGLSIESMGQVDDVVVGRSRVRPSVGEGEPRRWASMPRVSRPRGGSSSWTTRGSGGGGPEAPARAR